VSVMYKCRLGQRPVSATWLCRCPSVGGLVHQDLCAMRGDLYEETKLSVLYLYCGGWICSYLHVAWLRMK